MSVWWTVKIQEQKKTHGTRTNKAHGKAIRVHRKGLQFIQRVEMWLGRWSDLYYWGETG